MRHASVTIPSLLLLLAAGLPAGAQIINDWSNTGGVVTSVEQGAIQGDEYAAEGIISGWEDVLQEFEQEGEEASKAVEGIITTLQAKKAPDGKNVYVGADGRRYELPQMLDENGIDMFLLTEEGMTIYMAFDAAVFFQDIDEDIIRWVRYYAYTKRSYTRRVFERYRDWEPRIKQYFRSVGVPEELAELCLIESGCTYTAKSSAGALGMWQFMPATARAYGLRVDDQIDDRLDPVISTQAAARLLRDNFRKLGEWTIAAAAYNCGAGRFRVGQQWTDVRPKLPKETQQYIPGLIAMHYVWTYRDKLGFDK